MRRSKRLSYTGLLAALCSCGLFLSMGQAAAEDEKTRIERQRAQAQAEQARLRSSLEGVEASLGQTFLQLQQTREQLPAAQQALSQAQAKLGEAQRAHQVVEQQLKSAQSQQELLAKQIQDSAEKIDSSQALIGSVARRMYRGQDRPSTLELVVTAQTTEDFSRRALLLDAASRTQNQVLEQLRQQAGENANRQAQTDALAKRITTLEAEAAANAEKQRKENEAAAAKAAELKSLESQQASLASQLQDQSETIKANIAELEAENAARAARIAVIDEENRRRAAQTPQTPQTPQAPPNAQVPAGSGFFRPPIPPPLVVTSNYGWRTHPVVGTRLMHQGVDLASPCGQTQVAAAAGVVSDVTRTSTGGNTIYINHGFVNGASWITGYLHLSSFAVSVGQSVAAGQAIGQTGATGRVTGCHVHFEVWRNGATLNPMSLPGF